MCLGDFFERARYVRNVLAFEVSRFGDVVIAQKMRASSSPSVVLNLFDVPDEELSFVTFRVGILSRIEAALRIASSRAARNRECLRLFRVLTALRLPGSSAGKVGRAGHCRKASFRSAARAIGIG